MRASFWGNLAYFLISLQKSLKRYVLILQLPHEFGHWYSLDGGPEKPQSDDVYDKVLIQVLDQYWLASILFSYLFKMRFSDCMRLIISVTAGGDTCIRAAIFLIGNLRNIHANLINTF